MAGGFDYLEEGKSQGGINKKKLSNLQTDQSGMDESPAEGGEGYVGGNSNASAMGFDYVTGKKGYSQDKPIWTTETPDTHMQDRIPGGSEPNPVFKKGGSDPTDEKATYKHVQTDEGLPQTYRDSKGAGDAGPSGSDEPDQSGGEFPGSSNHGNPDTQDVGEGTMSDMPITEFTSNDGGGAPLFKHSK